MKILHIGDIVGKPGRNAVQKLVPELRKKHGIDFVIANADNLAHGGGVTQKTAQVLLDSGVDAITNGDHVWDKEEGEKVLKKEELCAVRALNLPKGTPGKGVRIFDVGKEKLAVMGLQGNVFMRAELENPFLAAEQALEKLKKQGVRHTFIDFHAEATSEKIALLRYLDGRVSALCGTHTHVPTADAQVTKAGTAYITDTGMCGPIDSVLGVKNDIIVYKFLTQRPHLHEVAEGEVEFDSVLITLDGNGKATAIEQIIRRVK